MRILTLGLSVALLTPAARADRFHFGSHADAKKNAAGEVSVVDGVLLREHEGQFVIRVVGGEMWIDKTLVYQVDKDDLTVDAIAKQEQAQQDQIAQANAKRHERQVAEAAAARRARAVAEASASREAATTKELNVGVDLDGLLPDYTFRPSSEVLRRLDLTALSREIEDYLRKHGVEPDPHVSQRDFRVNVDFKGLLPAYGFTIYDPVIHRIDLEKLARQVEDFLRAHLRRAANRPAERPLGRTADRRVG